MPFLTNPKPILPVSAGRSQSILTRPFSHRICREYSSAPKPKPQQLTAWSCFLAKNLQCYHVSAGGHIAAAAASVPSSLGPSRVVVRVIIRPPQSPDGSAAQAFVLLEEGAHATGAEFKINITNTSGITSTRNTDKLRSSYLSKQSL